MTNKKLFAKILFGLNILQLIAPVATLKAKAASPVAIQSPIDLGLPTRKAFSELAASWEGLSPAAYVKDTSGINSSTSSADQIFKLVGAQKASLRKTRHTTPLAEALSFFNNLAAPAKAIENLNCTKRLMSDLQMFGPKGLHQSFNRTILALGQTLQLAQLYEGADSQETASERRDFITGLLKTPAAARALTLRIKCFGQYESQFLRQANIPRNKSLEEKIKAIEPSRFFGSLRNNPNFLRLHTLITQKTVGYEVLKSTYIFSTLWLLTFLLIKGQLKSFFNTENLLKKLQSTAKAGGNYVKPNLKEMFFGQTQDEETREERDANDAKRIIKAQIPATTLAIAHEELGNYLKDTAGTRRTLLYQIWNNLRNPLLKTELNDFFRENHTKNGVKKLLCDIAAGPFLPFLVIAEALLTTKQGDPLNPRLPSLRLDAYKSLGKTPENFSTALYNIIHQYPEQVKNLMHSDPQGVNLGTNAVHNIFKAIDPFGLLEQHDKAINTRDAAGDILEQSGAGDRLKKTNIFLVTNILRFFPGITNLMGPLWSEVPGTLERNFLPTYLMAWNRTDSPLAEVARLLTGNMSYLTKKAQRFGRAGTSILDLVTQPARTPVQITDPCPQADGTTLTIEAIARPTEIASALSSLMNGEAPQAEFFAIKKTNLDGTSEYLPKEEAAAAFDRIIKNKTDGIASWALKKTADGAATIADITVPTNQADFQQEGLILGLGIETWAAGAALFAGATWANKVNKVQEKQFLIKALDEHMFSALKPSVSLAEMVRQISGILHTHQSSIPLPKSLEEKLHFIVKTASPECKAFSLAAKDPLFSKENLPGTFGNFGVIRQAYKLADLPEVKAWLSACAVFIAEVDSYLGIARLAAEHRDYPNYFSPVEFIDQDAPHIALTGFWFPLIGSFASIANSITIGEPSHILLTGINGGGKTIALKGMVFAILMIMAFGYGPFSEAKVTFIQKIITHLSSVDNAAEGDSCWIAEAKSMAKALHEMQSPHNPGERILYVGDELGSGTADHAAIAAVAQFMEIALTSPHVASIISTHLRELTQLEEISNGMVKNHRVGGTVDKEGTIQRKYRVERGIADINIAELIVDQMLEYGEQKTAIHPDNNQQAIQA